MPNGQLDLGPLTPMTAVDRSNEQQFPDPISFLEGFLPGNPFLGEPPLPRGLFSPREVKLPEPAAAPTEKPGCVAANESLLAHAHLDRLGRGAQGFSLLRNDSQARLEKAAAAAQQLGRPDLATELRAIAGQVTEVNDAKAAAELADRLEPVTDQCWELGRNCGKQITLADIEHAVELAQQVQNGTRNYAGALAELRGDNANADGSSHHLPEPDA